MDFIKKNLPTLVSILVCAAGSVGAIIYGVFSEIPGPFYYSPHEFEIWNCCFLVGFGVQLILIVKEPSSRTKRLKIFYLITYIFATLIAFINFLLLAIAELPDGAGWGGVLFLYLVFVLFILKNRVSDDDDGDSDEGASKVMTYIFVWNNVTAWCVIVFMGLMMGGSGTHAFVHTTYKPSKTVGGFAKVNVDGNEISIYFECDGPENGIIHIADSSFSHGVADFWPLTEQMKESNKRICIYDNPGVGW